MMTKYSELFYSKLVIFSIILLCCINLTSCASFKVKRANKRYKKCIVEFGNFNETERLPVFIEKEVLVETQLPADSVFISDCSNDTVFQTEYLETSVKNGTVTTRTIQKTLYDTQLVQIHDTIEVINEVNWQKPDPKLFNKTKFNWNLLIWLLIILSILAAGVYISKKLF